MLFFHKEDGYPMSICIETMSVDDMECEFDGYESIATDENGNPIAKFTHDTLRGRAHWAMGFFAGLKHPKDDPTMKCPFCGEEMNGIGVVHYKCKKCNEYFTN